MTDRRSTPSTILRWASVDLCAFLGINTYFALVGFARSSAGDDGTAFSTHFTEYLPQWGLWALFAPGLFLASRHMRIGIGRGLAPLLGHLALSVLTLAAYVLTWRTFTTLTTDGDFSGFFAQLSKGSTVYLLDYQWYWWITLAAHAYWGTTEAITRAREAGQLEAKAAELSSRLIQAELDTLKTQLHPHFLFNTHNAIAGLIRAGRDAAALDLIAHLSDFLRYALENKARQMVPLDREFDFVRKYLDIQQVRFGDRLRVDWDVDDQCLRVQVPPLLLQPLVENAVHHGVRSRATDNFVRMRARLSNARLIIEIFNSNGGVDDHTGFGLGLQNVHGRLRRIYGTAYTLDLDLLSDGQMRLGMSLPAKARTLPSSEDIDARDTHVARR